MLSFTTSAPHSMFEDRTEPLVPVRSPKVIGEQGKSISIYLHGVVEGEAGFDIPIIIDGELTIKDKVVAPCQVELPGKIIPCTLFMWNTRHKGTLLVSNREVDFIKGLIVATDDKRSIKYAKKLLKEKTLCL